MALVKSRDPKNGYIIDRLERHEEDLIAAKSNSTVQIPGKGGAYVDSHRWLEQLFQDETQNFQVKATSDTKEIQTLLEVGFEFVCQKEELMFFRKRK